jgi:hypothetical protein
MRNKPVITKNQLKPPSGQHKIMHVTDQKEILRKMVTNTLKLRAIYRYR